MKKYLFRVSLVVLFSFSTLAVYFGCTEDETAAFFDLTGRWAGMAITSDGAAMAEFDIAQDTTGQVTGYVYVFAQETDTVTFSGMVSEGHFTGIAFGQCPSDIELDVKNDGLKLEGEAVDQVSAACDAHTVDLLFYKIVTTTENVTGTWNGTHTGSDGSGNFVMTLNQSGTTVTGELIDTDTTSVNGRMIGDVLQAIINFSECPVLILMEISGNNMQGKYANAGDGQGGCVDEGTVTANRSTGKVVKK